MIVDALWAVLMFVARGVASLARALSVEWEPIDWAGFGSVIESLGNSEMWSVVRWINYYLPLSEALAVAGIFLAFYVGIVVYRAVVTLLQWAHVLGGSTG